MANIPVTANTPPAVVVGDGLNALGVIRSLGQEGIPVLALVSNPRSLPALSRFARVALSKATSGQPLLDTLHRITDGMPELPVLFLTEEGSVRTVSDARDALSSCYRIRLPDHERLMELMHKEHFQRLAEAVAAPIPALLRLSNENDLKSLNRLRFPAVLKPAYKNYDYGARFKKAYVVQSATEARSLWHEIQQVMPDLVVQEWIEGEDSDIYFCLQYIGADGLIASFPGRKIRSWPLRIGGTASCTAAWEYEHELTELTSSFFKATGFTGMGSMEFKRDARDGRFYMIEPTVARTDFQEEIATLNGVNLPAIAYCYEAGLAPAAPTTRPPIKAWREPVDDRWAYEASGRKGKPDFSPDQVVNAYLRWSDPVPWIEWMRNRVLAKIKAVSQLPGSQSR